MLLAVLVWAGLAPFAVYTAVAGEAECGSLKTHYGPFDYTNREHFTKKLPVVEQYHFDSNVEMLIKGKSGYMCSELDYVLKAFPNHHRALRSLALYQMKTPALRIRSECPGQLSVDCYFDRAKRMNPTDAEVYVIHGWYLHLRGQLDKALAEYRHAEEIKSKALPDRDYKIGLLLFDMKNYDEARTYAERAYKRGYPNNELRDKLRSVGR